MDYKKCSKELPKHSGEYEVIYSMNGQTGHGFVKFDANSNKWDIPIAIKSFYSVVSWRREDL